MNNRSSNQQFMSEAHWGDTEYMSHISAAYYEACQVFWLVNTGPVKRQLDSEASVKATVPEWQS